MPATPHLTGSSTKSWVVSGALFLLGYYLLPTQRARHYYLLMWATAIGGFWPGMEKVPRHPDFHRGVESGTFGGWLPGWDVTLLSFVLWGASACFLVAMYREVHRHRRALAAAVEPVELQEAPQAPVAQPKAVAPATTAPAPDPAPWPPGGSSLPPSWVKPRSRLNMATTTESGLHIPSHTRRRVRRGGETLSGTPIKDRRTVDPRSL